MRGRKKCTKVEKKYIFRKILKYFGNDCLEKSKILRIEWFALRMASKYDISVWYLWKAFGLNFLSHCTSKLYLRHDPVTMTSERSPFSSCNWRHITGTSKKRKLRQVWVCAKFVVCCWNISVWYFSKGFYQRFPMHHIWYVNSKSMTYIMLRTYWRQLTNSWRHIFQYWSDKTTEGDGKWTHNSSVHHGTNTWNKRKSPYHKIPVSELLELTKLQQLDVVRSKDIV